MKDSSVLIVEDDLGLMTVLTRVLKKVQPNVQLSWAGSVTEGIEVIQRCEQGDLGDFDLILSDLLLPNGELGTSLWHYCKHRQPETPFAVMSCIDPTSYFRMFRGGEEPPPFLPKPFRVEDCQELFSFLLLGHGTGAFGG